MNNFTPEQFEEIKNKAEDFYKNLDSIYCPYLKDKVSFSALGLEHLKFKRREKPRSSEDQYMRFKLLHLAPEIIKVSHTLQGIWETKKFERVRIHSRTEEVLKLVTYYEFIAVIKRNRVKVIVKQIDHGAKFFWSLIPFWGMNKTTMERILYEGIPDED